MEQKTSADTSSANLDDSSNSPPQKRAKRQPKQYLPPLEATSINAAETDDNLMGTNHLLNQQSTNSVDADNQYTIEGMVYSILFSFRRRIVFWLPRRILSQTPPV